MAQLTGARFQQDVRIDDPQSLLYIRQLASGVIGASEYPRNIRESCDSLTLRAANGVSMTVEGKFMRGNIALVCRAPDRLRSSLIGEYRSVSRKVARLPSPPRLES